MVSAADFDAGPKYRGFQPYLPRCRIPSESCPVRPIAELLVAIGTKEFPKRLQPNRCRFVSCPTARAALQAAARRIHFYARNRTDGGGVAAVCCQGRKRGHCVMCSAICCAHNSRQPQPNRCPSDGWKSFTTSMRRSARIKRKLRKPASMEWARVEHGSRCRCHRASEC